jgi:hypothetical protein
MQRLVLKIVPFLGYGLTGEAEAARYFQLPDIALNETESEESDIATLSPQDFSGSKRAA